MRSTVSGWTSPAIVGAAVAAVALLGAFARLETVSVDPLMPLRMFCNRDLVVGVTATFVYMGTFGALPYFLTVVFQTVHQFTALQAGLAFLVPSLAIAAGTQLGERVTTRLGTRRTLLAGFLVGAAGTVILATGFDSHRGYLAVVPGLVISGLGQGVTWTAMWITTTAGVAASEQGVASSMASTTLNLGNAIGLAVLIAIANADHHGGNRHSADGSRTAVLIAAAGMLIGALIARGGSRRAEGGRGHQGDAEDLGGSGDLAQQHRPDDQGHGRLHAHQGAEDGGAEPAQRE